MTEYIPLLNDPFYQFTASLNGTDVQFTVRWNGKMQAWVLSAELLDGTPIFQSRKMIPWSDFFANITNPSLVTGRILLSRTGYEAGNPPPSETNLNEWVLVYEF